MAELASLRVEFEELRARKHLKFDELDKFINRIINSYPEFFPKYSAKKKSGVRVVYHFNVQNIFPISLEREHKGRDFLLPKFAKLALNGIEDVLDYVEEQL